MAYDSIGRSSQTTLAQGATTGTYTTAYNATNGRIDTLTYPSSFVAKYVYTALGYLSQVEDNATSSVLFTVNTRDAELHATQQTAGNGVVTNLTYAATTGQATAINAGSGAVAALGFSYDTLGNLTGRSDTNQGVYEKFCYDNLNRLTNSATAASSPSLCSSTGGGITSKTVAYDQLGNITSKSDVGSYTYSGSGAGPHAVTSITGTVNGVTNPTYTYDNNGNMTAGAGRSVGYTSFNMANSIAQGTLTATIVYDGDHMRFKMSHLTSGTTTDKTLYRNDPISGGAEELFINSSAISWSDYIRVDGQIVAQRSCQTIPGASSCSATPTWLYFVTDHLGSTSVLTNSAGTVTERLSYDAWGRRRNADGTDNSGCSITSATTRGFTGHEMLDNLCEINANARIYDPTIGKFMSPDPFVQNPLNGQSFNRYSYVRNNPLSLIDPSGYIDNDQCDKGAQHCTPVSGGDDDGDDSDDSGNNLDGGRECLSCSPYYGYGVEQHSDDVHYLVAGNSAGNQAGSGDAQAAVNGAAPGASFTDDSGGVFKTGIITICDPEPDCTSTSDQYFVPGDTDEGFQLADYSRPEIRPYPSIIGYIGGGVFDEDKPLAIRTDAKNGYVYRIHGVAYSMTIFGPDGFPNPIGPADYSVMNLQNSLTIQQGTFDISVGPGHDTYLTIYNLPKSDSGYPVSIEFDFSQAQGGPEGGGIVAVYRVH
ncbi:MAG TPA: RHS repeat-associated core domain-containing protein [Rhizomicrobium sp.]|nr:RHS repeat-associated core domain-containing protein [Rhizomicrobium sp.]